MDVSPLDLIAYYESNGQNVLQTAYSGQPGAINPSTGTHTAPSTAGGPWQITNSTWKGSAPQAGVDIGQYPTAMSAPVAVQRQVAQHLYDTQGYAPWAPWNRRLAAAIGWTGQAGAAAPAAPPGNALLSGLSDPQGLLAKANSAISSIMQPPPPVASANAGPNPLVGSGPLPTGALSAMPALRLAQLASVSKASFQPVEYDPFNEQPKLSASGGIPLQSAPDIRQPIRLAAPAGGSSPPGFTPTPSYVTMLGMRSLFEPVDHDPFAESPPAP